MNATSFVFEFESIPQAFFIFGNIFFSHGIGGLCNLVIDKHRIAFFSPGA
jgi:hypothetical protein